jgi:hypothetical protein
MVATSLPHCFCGATFVFHYVVSNDPNLLVNALRSRQIQMTVVALISERIHKWRKSMKTSSLKSSSSESIHLVTYRDEKAWQVPYQCLQKSKLSPVYAFSQSIRPFSRMIAHVVSEYCALLVPNPSVILLTDFCRIGSDHNCFPTSGVDSVFG